MAESQLAIRKADRTRQAILDAALEFLWSHSFRDLKVARLMTEVGASRPTFYQYFPDLNALMETQLADLIEDFDSVTWEWFDAPQQPRQALAHTLESVVKIFYRKGPIIRATIEAAPMDAQLSAAWEAMMTKYDIATAGSIERDQAAGLVGPINAMLVGQALNRMNVSFALLHFGRRPRTQLSRVLPSLVHIWVSSIYGKEIRS